MSTSKTSLMGPTRVSLADNLQRPVNVETPPENSGVNPISRSQYKDPVSMLPKLIEEKGFDTVMRAIFAGKPADLKPKTLFQEAQRLMDDAHWMKYKKRRISKARQVLRDYPNCARAYMLLADEAASTVSEQIDLYRQAVDVGRETFFDVVEDDRESKEWKYSALHDFRVALASLGTLLRDTNEIEEAIEVWQEEELMEYPQDQVVVWRRLIPALIQANRFSEADIQLRDCPDQKSCIFLYSRALLNFKEHGSTKRNNEALGKAISANRFAAELILGGVAATQLFDEDEITPGSEEEAHSYSTASHVDWSIHPGAFDWLSATYHRI